MSTPATLNINTSIVAHGDPTLTNNPRLKFFDWTRNMNGLSVFSPKSEHFVVPAWGSRTLFDGARTLATAADTQLSIALLQGSTYRISVAGGTDPNFATDTGLTFNSTEFAVTVGSDQTITIAAAVGTPFTTVSEDDEIYIYSTTDNASAAFGAPNAGFWTVLSIDNGGGSVTLARHEGEEFQGVAETVTCASAGNMIGFTFNVQVGDKVWLDAPFARATRGSYDIQSVTSKWIDVVSTTPLAAQTGITMSVTQGSESILIFSECKRFVRLETDRRASVSINGVSGNRVIEPWTPGDNEAMGWYELAGYTWSLRVENRTSSPMSVNLFTAE